MKNMLMLENLPYKSNIKIGSHHYAEEFSKDYKVLWVSLPWHIFQFIKNKDNDRIRNWNKGKMKSINTNLYSLTPFVFLPYRNNILLRSDFYLKNYFRYMFMLKKHIKKSNFLEVDFLWITDPRHYGLINKIKYKKLYYRCVDDLEEFNDIPRNIIKYEKDIIKMANAVFFTSEKLLNKYKQYNNNSYYLSNGCDYDFFNQHKKQVVEKKIFFKENKINIVYTGTIAEWFDFDAVRILAENEENNLIIIGPIRINIPSELKKMDNVYFAGAYPYENMSYFVNNADICLIPFKINEITDSVNPIKIYEYCAAGKQSIVSGFKTILDLNGPYNIYTDKESLILAYKEALNKYNDINHRLLLKNFAKNNSWKKRAEQVKNIFER